MKIVNTPVIVNIFVKSSWRYSIHAIFYIYYIFNFFQIIMVSLFFARRDQYFIMFKDSNVFQFTNFLFKTKYNTKLLFILLLAIIYSEDKTGKKIVEKKIFRQNSMIFEESPNSLTESYFTGELRLGES